MLKAMTQGKYVGLELPSNMKDFLKINEDFFLQRSRRVADEVCLKTRGVDTVAQVTI